MKKVLLLTSICLLVLLLGACKSPGEKISEKIAEEMITEAIGEEVDFEEGTVTFESEDGEEVKIGGTEWPTDMIAEHIPKLNAGEVTAAYNSSNSCMLTVENVNKEQFEDYLSGIKGKGFNENTLDISEGEYTHYYGENGEFGIQLTFDGATKEAGINFMRLEF